MTAPSLRIFGVPAKPLHTLPPESMRTGPAFAGHACGMMTGSSLPDGSVQDRVTEDDERGRCRLAGDGFAGRTSSAPDGA